MHKLIVGLVSTVVLFSLTACGEQAPDEGTMNGTTGSEDLGYSDSPRDGWVLVNVADNVGTHVIKRCDGSTLVYLSDGHNSGGVSVIPNSPECTS